MNAKIDAIIQARMDSSRLPGKIILPIGGKPILAHIIERLQRSNYIRHIIIATTADSYSAVQPVSNKYPKVKIFTGNKNNVLSRYTEAAKKYESEIIVRATGDNPLVSPEYVDKAIAYHLKTASDLTHYPDIPLGTGVEVITAGSLKKTLKLTEDPYDYEHVTPFLYKNKDLFRVSEPNAPHSHHAPHIKVTVDTPQDYKKVCGIFEYYNFNDIEIPEIIKYFKQIPKTLTPAIFAKEISVSQSV